MPKEAFYFSHDYSARNDDKILELRSEFGAEGYGIFWMILETMAENEDGGCKISLMGGLSVGYGLPIGRLSDIIRRCIEIGLFYKEEDKLFSKRLLRHKYIRKNLRESGKKAAKKRWGTHNQPIGNLRPTQDLPIADPMPKERKGKESKEELELNPKVIATATTVGSQKVAEAANEAWTDKLWVKNLAAGHSMSEELIQKWMHQYNSSICNDKIEGFNTARYKKMFGGWLIKQSQKGNTLPTGSKLSTNGKPLDEVIKKYK